MISAQVSQLSVENVTLLLEQAVVISPAHGFPECSRGWIPSYPGVSKESGARLLRAGSLSAATTVLQTEFVLPLTFIAFPEVFCLEISNTSLSTNIYVFKKKKRSEVQPFIIGSERGFSP